MSLLTTKPDFSQATLRASGLITARLDIVSACLSWRLFRVNHFLWDFHTQILTDLFLDHCSTMGVATIVSDFSIRTIDRVGGCIGTSHAIIHFVSECLKADFKIIRTYILILQESDAELLVRFGRATAQDFSGIFLVQNDNVGRLSH